MRLPVSQLGRTILCSWLKIRLETWPPQLCWARPPSKGTAELGACLSHSALFSSDTFPWPLSTAQQSHLSINRHASTEIVLPKDTAFRPQPCPHSTSSYLLSCQDVPCSLFFHWLSASTQGPCDLPHLQELPHPSPVHRHANAPPPPSIEHSLRLWAEVIGFEPMHKATHPLKPPFISSMPSWLFPSLEMLVSGCFFRTFLSLSLSLSPHPTSFWGCSTHLHIPPSFYLASMLF